MKDASIMCHLDQIESIRQSLSSDCLCFGSVYDEEREYQSSDYEGSASSGLLNNITI